MDAAFGPTARVVPTSEHTIAITENGPIVLTAREGDPLSKLYN
jgi:hypothetical protein